MFARVRNLEWSDPAPEEPDVAPSEVPATAGAAGRRTAELDRDSLVRGQLESSQPSQVAPNPATSVPATLIEA